MQIWCRCLAHTNKFSPSPTYLFYMIIFTCSFDFGCKILTTHQKDIDAYYGAWVQHLLIVEGCAWHLISVLCGFHMHTLEFGCQCTTTRSGKSSISPTAMEVHSFLHEEEDGTYNVKKGDTSECPASDIYLSTSARLQDRHSRQMVHDRKNGPKTLPAMVTVVDY